MDPDDRLLLRELRSRGLTASAEVWSDTSVDWAASRLCILRSAWDYHARYSDFMAWIAHVASVTTIRNDIALLHWNAHKSYIRKIELLGVPVVPTVWLAQGERHFVDDLFTERGWHDVVIKPARGAAAHNVLRVNRDGTSLASAQQHLDLLLRSQDVLVQPYLESVVSYGERALIFFHDRFSHAVVKKPFDKVLAVSDERSDWVEVTNAEMGIALKALKAIPGRSLYARVDLLLDDNGWPCVSEVELIEPALYMGVHDPARTTFADAVERELDTIRKRMLPSKVGYR